MDVDFLLSDYNIWMLQVTTERSAARSISSSWPGMVVRLHIPYYTFFFFFAHSDFPASGQKPWSQVSSLPSPRFLPSIFIAHRVQHSHCSSIFYQVLLTHAIALSASQFVHKKKCRRRYTRNALGGARTHETNLYHARG